MSSTSFSQQIWNAERAITRETKKLELLKAVRPMFLYEFLNSSQSHNAKYAEWRYMGRFIEARDEYMVIETFACTQIIYSSGLNGVQGITGLFMYPISQGFNSLKRLNLPTSLSILHGLGSPRSFIRS